MPCGLGRPIAPKLLGGMLRGERGTPGRGWGAPEPMGAIMIPSEFTPDRPAAADCLGICCWIGDVKPGDGKPYCNDAS